MPREAPVTSATVPASLLVMFVLIYLPDDLPLGFESAQYFVPCAAMLSRHNAFGEWNSDICDTFWRLVRP